MRTIAISGMISINLNKLEIVTEDQLRWDGDITVANLEEKCEDNFALGHNHQVLNLNLPRELCFEVGDIPIDINCFDEDNDWFEDGVLLGWPTEEGEEEEGFGETVPFIGYLPARILEGKKDGDVITFELATNEARIIINLECSQKNSRALQPFDRFEDAFEFMIK